MLRASPLTQAIGSPPDPPCSCSALWKTKPDNASLYNLNVMSERSLHVAPALSSVFFGYDKNVSLDLKILCSEMLPILEQQVGPAKMAGLNLWRKSRNRPQRRLLLYSSRSLSCSLSRRSRSGLLLRVLRSRSLPFGGGRSREYP